MVRIVPLNYLYGLKTGILRHLKLTCRICGRLEVYHLLLIQIAWLRLDQDRLQDQRQTRQNFTGHGRI